MFMLQTSAPSCCLHRQLHATSCPAARQAFAGCQRPKMQLRRLLQPALTFRGFALKPGCGCRRASSAARSMAKKTEDDSPYKNTVNLPQTKFNMRANSKQREPELQRFWAKQQVYEQLSRNNPGVVFTLHDGPPYANGDLHCGHALNKVLKDIINRYQLLQGRRAKYVPGWDCHGLPIELKVLQAMTEEQRRGLDPIKLRRKARDFATKTVKSQRNQFQRFGVWADWDSPYLTLDAKYEAAQLRVFAKMVANGHIYRSRKPVHWSPSSQTALAESELEYPEGHTSRSVYVGMPLVQLGGSMPPDARQHLEGASLAVWTTTPWTLPANAAVAVNSDLQYSVVQAQEGHRLVIAQELRETLQEKLDMQLTTLASFPGAALEGCSYSHPLAGQEAALDRVSPVVIGGDYITTETGTGLVHTAPGHGLEDYHVGLKYGLPTMSPVDDAGLFTKEAGPSYQGKSVLGDGNSAVLEALAKTDHLLKEEKYPHRYPYDWRSKQPVIFRATEQWFASVGGFQSQALDAIQEVQWVPPSGIARITAMTAGRSDWCISRQRKWGVPIPVFYDKETGEALMTQEVIEHVASLVEQKGSDIWWQADTAALLPDSLQSRAETLKKGLDTMDVWFDSGSSWAACLQTDDALNFPADLYLEGSDQHRGWFQSSLLTSVAINGHAPYRNVLTHGFVLDERGLKMSKSIGNTLDPLDIIEGGKDQKANPAFGADVLRLWVASVDFQGDVLIGPNIIAKVADVYRKFRFTLRFLLGNLHDYDPAEHEVGFDSLPFTDRYMLHRLSRLLDDAQASYSSYQFFRAYQALQRFAVQELSNFYLDVAKDRLYTSGANSHERRSCQTVLAAVLRGLLAALGPILPHLAEDAWQSLSPALTQGHPSVFQAGWLEPQQAWSAIPDWEVSTAESLRAIRDHVNAVLEQARQAKLLGSSLEAKVALWAEDAELRENLRRWDGQMNSADPLAVIFIVSEAGVFDDADEVASGSQHHAQCEMPNGKLVAAGVTRADGHKCQRCWKYSKLVGNFDEHPGLCGDCYPVIMDMGFKLPQPEPAVAV